MWINSTGLCLSLFVLLAVNLLKPSLSPFTLAIICLSTYAIPVIILEWFCLKTYNNKSTGLSFANPPRSFNIKRVVIKLLGLYFTLALGGMIYWLFSEYDRLFYHPYYTLLRVGLPVLALLSIPYFLIVDRFMEEPHDSYWQMGKLCLLDFEAVRFNEILQHCLGWLVKIFFLPLMFGWFYKKVLFFQSADISTIFTSFKIFFDTTFSLLFYIDLLIVTVGYILTLRVFDSHIRSTEPTFLGWFVALQCYTPFWPFFEEKYLAYHTESWSGWLANFPILYSVCGVLILLLTGIYVWATIPFGIRFSNLTHRGILTNGPYKYCKHPAYISKNLSWWLISLPFLSTVGPQEAIKHSLLLLLVNFVYFMRARTEERHLSWDPDYIAYAEYIEQKGIFSWIGKQLPIIKFKANRLLNIEDQTPKSPNHRKTI